MPTGDVADNKCMKAFTVKSLIAGLLGLLIVVGFSKFNSALMLQGDFIGCHLGLAMYFYFLLICLLWNPLTHRLIPLLEFNLKEMSVIVVMTLTGGGFAWIGWMRQMLIQSALIPIKAATDSSWQKYKILELFNNKLFPNEGKDSERILGKFMDGFSTNNNWINISNVPFDGWYGALMYWGILILLISFMSLAMLMIVHRQWTRNEKLSYPLTTIIESLYTKSDKKFCFADVFRSKLFWFAFSVVVAIHGYNYLAAWFPKVFTQISFTCYLTGLEEVIPAMKNTGIRSLQTVTFMFFIFGISYFLSPSLSLSVGLNAVVYLIFAAEVYNITGVGPSDANMQSMRAGSYVAFAVMLIVLGRRYYGEIFMKAFCIGKVAEDERSAIWGARLFLLTFVGITCWLCYLGMDFPVALVFTLLLVIVYLVFTRIVCEAGIPYMASPFLPVTVMSKLFSGPLIGPKNLMSTGLMSGVFFGDIRQLLVPFMATGAKVADDAEVKRGKVFTLIGASVVVSFLVAVLVFLWQYYSFGVKTLASKESGWRLGIPDAVTEVTRMHINGIYDAIAQGSFFERLQFASPEYETWLYFAMGIGAVLLFSFLRIRFLWWPLHAMIFCIWSTSPANVMWFSFLLGWFVRMVIVRFGGEHSYIKLKPFFTGIIFGEIFAAGCIMLTGVIYYFWNDNTPCKVVYSVFTTM